MNSNETKKFVDTHCHLNHADFADDLNLVMTKIAAANVAGLVCVGYDLSSSADAVKMTDVFPNMRASVGVHPNDADTFNPDVDAQLRDLAADTLHVCAIGETGLDYYRSECPHDMQQSVFRAHIQMAADMNLPLIVHTRDSQPDVLSILKDEGMPPKGAVMHCLPSDAEFAQAAINMGCYVGIGGVLTFRNADDLRKIAAAIPMDRIVLETDSPYLAPHPYRGKRNDPSLLPVIAERLAEVKGKSIAEIAEITTRNAHRLFSIKCNENKSAK